MGVVGFDIGNENCAIAVAKRGEIDVLLNDESKRETPAVVSFGEKQRFLGTSGAAFATKFPKSTISQIKRLIGRFYKEPCVQKDLDLLPFDTSEASNGGILIHLHYLGERRTFMSVEILGMLFAHLKQITEKNLGSPVADCVIGIPSYFTDLQRREYLNAAHIAGLSPLRLMHDCTATALGYGMYKTDFSNEGPTNVMFVDIGHSDTQVTIAAFEKGKMTILSHSFDQNLGGRDFDEVLFRHFAAKFKEEHNIDVDSNTRASVRLRVSCEKLKKVLSANLEAPLSIECLIDDEDLNGFITREEFENLSVELLERVAIVCNKARNDSGINPNEIDTIELVGSGTRIPAIVKKLTSVFKKQPMRTLNGSECVARGCALYCAMLSPTIQVQEYKVGDIFPYSIRLKFDDGENGRHPKITHFQKGSPLPSYKTISYRGNTTFSCKVFYNNKTDSPDDEISPIAGRFRIEPSQTSRAKYVKATVEVALNDNGIIELQSASAKQSRSKDYLGIQDLQISENYVALTTIDDIKESQKKAQILADQDIKVEHTKEKKNTLESFIYDTRSKLLNSYAIITTESEVEEISKKLQETEGWLYGEGDDESEDVYIGKLEYLKKLLDLVENRYKEEIAKKKAATLQTCIEENRYLLPSSQRDEDSLAKSATCTSGSSDTNGITQALKGKWKVIKNSIPLLQKHKEHVDLDHKQNPDDMEVDP